MQDHMKTVRKLVAAGEKATPGPTTTSNDIARNKYRAGVALRSALPALAALLRVVEAAKELCELRGDTTEGDRENLRAALRDLEPKEAPNAKA